ncbi:hypothetical protein [Vibrio cholerae]|uniref:hypothetical protein n=1 Tax=Vibrio cholerae TaxID=666 RepID=UPI0004E3A752|nr:hypothetical protein [Vibrio cholerae]EGR1087873.1 hypothetical protein [Vibrio cholerae]KFE25076.1 hypothetical protein DA89_243 [Vibrio cholerae]TXZ35057.1 hypothetical protein FXE66_05725 [Vibrio cholerae]BCK29976.1 hypothetical protein VCSRO77_3395 [Vibrio cholerae]
METVAVKLVDYEYRKINISQGGVFVNRSPVTAYMLERAEQPSVNEEGDPMVPYKRYSYQLGEGFSIWARSVTGSFNVGVTPNDN